MLEGASLELPRPRRQGDGCLPERGEVGGLVSISFDIRLPPFSGGDLDLIRAVALQLNERPLLNLAGNNPSTLVFGIQMCVSGSIYRCVCTW